MEWVSEALLIGLRPHGETSAVIEVMTPDYGRHLGLVKGARSRRLQPVLQAGNSLLVTWRARLETHLGLFSVELSEARAARLMESAAGVFGVQIVAGHLRLLAEREVHPGLYRAAITLLDHLDGFLQSAALVARFELMLLDELGFGLDLTRCAATGRTDDLRFVSPKSARAVCGDAGAPYADRLLSLPAFLLPGADDTPDAADVAAALKLTGFFLDRHVAGPRAIDLPSARAQMLGKLEGERRGR
ncbi:DNA repair protein RecO [Pleomorphomonas carboxyditropha]|uniref:DNA repair protein RecO n=1 Tax=Pleomorphomonas carboxyditropha TaxID=2023338 RepID=A0A2G9X1L5_9HYPH|nr:DNA repair protein RecO [Pleomorphomonas carboxyditropha]